MSQGRVHPCSHAGFRFSPGRFIFPIISVLAFSAAPKIIAQDVKVIDLSPNPSPEAVAQARREYRNGSIVRMAPGRQTDLQRLLSVGGMTARRKGGSSSFSAADDAAPRIVAVRLASNGALHQFAYFTAETDLTAGQTAFARWADREKQFALGMRPDIADPQPPAQAWTQVQQTTVAGSDNDQNKYQTTATIYRLNDISSAGDWYMALTDPEIQPNFYKTDCATAFNSCGWYSSERIVTMSTNPGFVLFDHGPTQQITSDTAGFTIGGTLNPTGPGVSATYSTSWPQPSVVTKDKSDLTSGTGQWHENFRGQGFWSAGRPPLTSTALFLSHQGSIFQVPEGTTSFYLDVNVYFKTMYHDAGGDNYNEWTYDISGPVSAPIVAIDPPAVNITPGSSTGVQLTATIPNSNYGLPWNLMNLPAWLTASQISGSGSTRVALSVAPGTAVGTTGSLNFNTNPEFAAPSVETNPLIVTVKVVESDAVPGVLAVGGEDFALGPTALASAQIVEPNVEDVPPMTAQRASHTATLMQDGKLLVAGGTTQAFAPGLASAELFDPSMSTFSPVGAMTTARQGHTATLLTNGKVLITGGQPQIGVASLATAELYDPATSSFTATGLMTIGRVQHTATRLQNGDVLICGGNDGVAGQNQTTAEIYSVANGAFNPTTGPPITARSRHTSTLLKNGDVLIAGGIASNNGAAYASAEGFSPATGSFFPLLSGALNQARLDHTATLLNDGSVLLTGGGQQSQVTTDLATAERYDPEHQIFNPVSGTAPCPGAAGCMTSGRRNHTATLLPNGQVFLAGGLSGDGNQSFGTSEIFDPASQTFTSGPAISPRAFHTATLILPASRSAVTLNSSLNPSTVGQEVKFTATIDRGIGTVTPTGLVTFKDGGQALGSAVQTVDGVASFSTDSLSVGQHAITATYSGDERYSASTSNTIYQSVANPVAMTSLISNPSTSMPNESVVFRATVSGNPGIAGPTGSVSFKDSATVLGGMPLVNGEAVFTTKSLSPGTHSVQAFYSGDSTYAASHSAPVNQIVQFTTSTSLRSDQNPSIPGQAVKLTAIVSVDSGNTVPMGTAAFSDNGVPIGDAVTLVNGQATVTTDALTLGSHSILVAFAGDDGFANSRSSVLPQVVQFATSTAVTSSANPSAVGQSITLTAAVTASGAGTLTGSVTFKDGPNAISGAVPLSTGTAKFATADLRQGSHSITAVYSGDSNAAASTSPILIQSVALASTTDLSAAPNPASLGSDVTLTATVIGSGGTPAGNITFLDGQASLGTIPLNSGKASFITSSLSGGTHQITAVYSGDSTYAGSTSPVVRQIIRFTTTTNLTSDPDPSITGQSVTFSATVNIGQATATPSGTVTFTDGAATLGSAVSLVGGKAALTVKTLGQGTHLITAVYSGDPNFGGSTSPAVTQTVKGSSTVTLMSSLNPSTAGQDVVLTTTVSGTGGTPTGMVTYKDDANVLATFPLDAGKAVFTDGSLAVGSHSLTAVYSGDATNAGATSLPLTQVVNQALATPVFGSLSPSQSISFGTASVALSGLLSAPGPVYPPAGEGITVTIGSVTKSVSLAAGGVFTVTSFPTDILAAGTYPVRYGYAGDSRFTAANDTSTTLTINKLTPVFRGLTASQSIVVGAASIALSGTIVAGALFPTGSVSISINGVSTSAFIGAKGSFSATFDTHAIPASTTPYPITYSFGANSNFAAASDTSTALTVSGTVGPGTTTTTLRASVQTCVTGVPFQLFITVASVAPATGVPQGQVVLSRKNPDGSSTQVGIQFLDTNGQWNPDLNGTNDSIPPGSYTLTALYQGSQDFKASTGDLPLTCVAQ
jgi:Bacterial Ig-like domain (group 3)/Galactose oxidase, central domain